MRRSPIESAHLSRSAPLSGGDGAGQGWLGRHGRCQLGDQWPCFARVKNLQEGAPPTNRCTMYKSFLDVVEDIFGLSSPSRGSMVATRSTPRQLMSTKRRFGRCSGRRKRGRPHAPPCVSGELGTGVLQPLWLAFGAPSLRWRAVAERSGWMSGWAFSVRTAFGSILEVFRVFLFRFRPDSGGRTAGRHHVLLRKDHLQDQGAEGHQGSAGLRLGRLGTWTSDERLNSQYSLSMPILYVPQTRVLGQVSQPAISQVLGSDHRILEGRLLRSWCVCCSMVTLPFSGGEVSDSCFSWS